MSSASVSDNTSNKNEWVPSFNPWIIALSVMLATFMEVLDTSIANVSLPHIAGSLSSSNEEATWVLTSYLISNAIILPATAWLSSRFGRKRFFILCIILFTLASLLCGISTSLGMLILARVLQGIGGGALQPVSQAILFESFPPAKRGVASAVFGMGVIFAPIIGPTLGGWITDNYSWHWIFFINIPVGILAVILSYLYVEDPPYVKAAKAKKVDYIGFGLMAVGLAFLQIILDKGQQVDWFAANWLRWMSFISLACLVLFVVRELKCKYPIVNLSILKDRNFAIGTILITVLGAVLYGTLAILPLFLQTLLGYSAELSGFAISPRGVGSFLVIIIMSRIITKVDGRLLTAIGFVLLAYSCYLLGVLNLDISLDNVIWPNIINGAALGFIFIPLSTITFATLSNEEIAMGTGLFNLMRNIGGSVGISAVTTLLANHSQMHQSYMVSNLNQYNPIFRHYLSTASNYLSVHFGSVNAITKANGLIYNKLLVQANLFSFMDNFRIFSFLCLLLIPLIFLFKVPKHTDNV